MARTHPLPAGSGRVSSFFLLGCIGFVALHGDLSVHLPGGLAGNATLLIGGGADALAIGRFSGDQTALLNQLLHQFGYESVSY